MDRIMKTALLTVMLWAHSPATSGDEVKWGPYGGFVAIEGGPVMVEVEALDASREVVLSRKIILLDESVGGEQAIRVYEPGVLNHEEHAQMRFRLQKGEQLFLELLHKKRARRADERAASVSVIAGVAIGAVDGSIVTRRIDPTAEVVQ